MNKKDVSILVLITLLAITGIIWHLTQSEGRPQGKIPYDNTYKWTKVFHGYKAYLDRDISYSTVHGASMEPTFGDNDKVLWVEVNPSELEVGNIIIYNQDKLIAHRIIDIMKNGGYKFETKGDNRAKSDAKTALNAYYVTEDDLVGLVIGVIYS